MAATITGNLMRGDTALSAFYDQIDEVMGQAEDTTDIVACVRKCWHYDFRNEPVFLWDGQGSFIDSEGREWLGTIDANGNNIHNAPSLQDGRDGTSASYNFSFKIPSLPGREAEILSLYEGLKSEQANVFGRTLTCYLVLFVEGEGVRPNTPLSFYKEMLMFSPKFSEGVERNGAGSIVKNYTVTITAKDNNHGRSEVPDRTYEDSMQKRRASQLGVALDRGCEFLAGLANRTFQIP